MEIGSRFVGVKGITKALAQVCHGDLMCQIAVRIKMSDFHFIKHSWINFVGNLKAHNAV